MLWGVGRQESKVDNKSELTKAVPELHETEHNKEASFFMITPAFP